MTYLKKTLLLKQNKTKQNADLHLIFQQVLISLLVEGLVSMLLAADCSGGWLLKVG